MKRFFAFFLLVVVFSSCDDGDLTQVSFEFDDSDAKSCPNISENNFFIYKKQGNRALIIQLPQSKFLNQVSADLATQPTPLTINNSSIKLIYREYSGEVTDNTFCSSIPTADPVVVKEYAATAGEITITTTAITSEPDANGATSIDNFLHTLVFKDLKFDLGDANNQINESFAQVTYKTKATTFLNFAGLPSLLSCPSDKTFLFKYKADPIITTESQALTLDLSDSDAAFLFSNDAGPKTRLLSAENKLTHLFFNTTTFFLTNDYFCTIPTPATPAIIDAYTAQNGVENQTGIIEVTTLASDNGFKHTIVLKKVRLVKGSLKKEMGDEFIFGEFETTN